MKADREAAARAIAAFLSALGYDAGRADLARTPERVASAFATELLTGEDVDLGKLLLEGSEASSEHFSGLVAVRRINVTTICPHHLLPAFGSASLAYLPGSRLVGLGTLTRLVDVCARRLTLQESIGESVVRALSEHVGARGAYCQIELTHTCLVARGSEQTNARLVTVARSGELMGPDASAQLSLAFGPMAAP